VNIFRLILQWGICAVFSCAVSVQALAAPSEYVVKTAFIYNFFKFTDWPAAIGAQNTYSLCFTGSADQYAEALSALDGKSAAGKSVNVKKDVHGEALKNCHMVVVTEADGADVVRELANLPVVTVSDAAGFVSRGGMIGLVQNDRRLAFEVNLESAGANNIRFSSQMLKLAKSVRGAK
jgi:hypothetical protein